MMWFFLYTHPSHPGKKQEALNSKDHPRKRGVISPVGNHLATAKMDDTLRASEIVVTAAAAAVLCKRSLLTKLRTWAAL